MTHKNLRILAYLMIAALAAALLPGEGAWAATARSTALDLTAASVTYTGGAMSGNPIAGNITDSTEGWQWYYDGDVDLGYTGPTLVLDDLDLSTADAIALKVPSDTTIVLASGSANTVVSAFAGSDDTYGILCEGHLSISGGGSLTARGGTVTGESTHYSCGITTGAASSILTVSGGATVTASGGGTGTAPTKGLSVGILSRVVVNGGNVTGNGGHANGLDSVGIIGRGSTDSPQITVNGGALTGNGGSSEYDSIGIAGLLAINGGTATATGGDGSNGSYGIQNLNTADITVSGGTVIAQANGGKALDTDSQPESNANIDISGYAGGYRWRTTSTGAYTASTTDSLDYGGQPYLEITIPASDITPPSWSGGSTLTASAITQTGATLSWSGASDETAVTAYRLYQDGALIQTTSATSHAVSGLSPDTGYSYRVEAGDAAGNWSTDGPTASVHTLTSSTPPDTYTITATAGANGSISPSGAVTVNQGGSQLFTIASDTGYRIHDVRVDGSSMGAVSSYTFSDVTADHTISVSFVTTDTAGNTGTRERQDDSQVTVDLTDGAISGQRLNELIAENRDKPVVFAGNRYTITFPTGSMSADHYSGDLDMGLSLNAGIYYDVIREKAGDKFVLMIDFHHSGALPGEAQIRIFVGEQYAGETLKYYYYDPQSGSFTYILSAKVDDDGSVLVRQDHCSSYLLTLYDADDIPVTGDTGTIWIWWLLLGVSVAGIIALGLVRVSRGRTLMHRVNP